MKKVGFVEDDQIVLSKLKRYIETQENFAEPIWRDTFKEAAAICIQRSKKWFRLVEGH